MFTSFVLFIEGTTACLALVSFSFTTCFDSATSIASYIVYARKKKPKKDKDPEWQYMVGNIIAALDGADNSMADAVMKGLVTGITENRSF